MVGLQSLPAAVERPRVAGLLVAVDHLVHVSVQTQALVDQSQHLLRDGGHLHAHLGRRILNEERHQKHTFKTDSKHTSEVTRTERGGAGVTESLLPL